jgi:hypothetical protein
MDVLHPYCAGIDVHKKTISVCVLTPSVHGQPQPQVREFGTNTRELLEMADWLLQNQITQVGMESTGVYWKPSGKAMARTGLRMMPTFPLPPLKFRTAGFPRYGFKAGLSDEAFPDDVWFAIALRALCCHRYSLLCVRDDALISTSVRADPPLYPRGPRSGPGSVVPVHLHLLGPIRPTRRHIPTSPSRG